MNITKELRGFSNFACKTFLLPNILVTIYTLLLIFEHGFNLGRILLAVALIVILNVWVYAVVRLFSRRRG